MNVLRVALPIVVAISFAFIAVRVDASEPVRVYIANDDHTDYYWTRGGEEYRHAFLEMLDYYLDLADETASERPEHQSRFNCDGSFWLWTYEHNRSGEQFERLIERIRDGHISVPLNPLPILYGGVPAEAIIRGMYYPGTIERRYDLRFPLVTGMELTTLPYGLGSLWAGSGARYCYHGICNCATPMHETPFEREHPMYWWVGPDNRRLLMKWYSMPLHSKHLGGYAEAYDPAAIVDYVTVEAAANGFRRGYPYSVIGAFGYGQDRLKTTTDEFVRVAKEKTNERQLVVVSNIRDFFEDFEETYGEDLPSQSVSFGNDWDLWHTTITGLTSRVRRSVERLRSAEALATAVSLRDPGFTRHHERHRRQVWMDLGVFYEHNWCATGVRVPVETRLNWARGLVERIEQYVDGLHDESTARFGDLLPARVGAPRFYVFNLLSWSRTDYADIAVPDARACHVVDIVSIEQVPHQYLTRDGQTILRILASDVPPVGYKILEIREGAGTSFRPAATVASNVIDHACYRVSVHPNGSLRSVVDKKNGNRQLVGRRFNPYRGLNDLGQSEGTVVVENSGPVSVTLRCDAAGPVRHTTRITMYRNIDRLSITNEIHQSFDAKHVWSYGFDLADPVVWHEETGAIIKAAVTSDGGHYSPVNARYDWLTINHFADISERGQYGVTLSNADCAFMQVGKYTSMFRLDTDHARIAVLAGGDVQGGTSRFPLYNQGGDNYFLQRFAIQSHASFDPAKSMRFALEHQNPLVAGWVSGAAETSPPMPSMIEIDNPNVLLWALKPSEEGIERGVIVRVWNLSNENEKFTLTPISFGLREARETTHIETDAKTLPVHDGRLTANLQPQQMQTYRLILDVETP